MALVFNIYFAFGSGGMTFEIRMNATCHYTIKLKVKYVYLEFNCFLIFYVKTGAFSNIL